MTNKEIFVVIFAMLLGAGVTAYAIYCSNNPIEDTQCECVLDYNK